MKMNMVDVHFFLDLKWVGKRMERRWKMKMEEDEDEHGVGVVVSQDYQHLIPSFLLHSAIPSLLSFCVSVTTKMASGGPGLFSDIGKRAKDLLTKDYLTDQKFSISSCSESGVAVTSTAVKKGGLSSGDVAASYKYKNTTIEAKVDTDSKIFTTFTVTDVVPSTKVITSFKMPDLSSHKLEAQYFQKHATFTTAATLNKNPIVDLTATLGTPAIAFGVEAGYDTTSGNFTKYTAGVNISNPDSCASIILGDKGDTINASYLHHLDQLKKSTAVAEISRRFSTNENTFTVGGLYAVDHLTVVKAKLNNHGKLGAVLQHQVIPKSMITISSEFDTMALDKSPKFGLALALKP